MVRLGSNRIGLFLSIAIAVSAGNLLAQGTPNPNSDPTATPALPPWPSLKVPTSKSVDELQKFISEVKNLQPTTPERYRDMQNLIREGSRRILELSADRSTDASKQAEFDFISSSVMLMGNEGPEAHTKTFERFRDYLQAKAKPDDNDLKMTLMAGQNLEQVADPKVVGEAYRTLAAVLQKKKLDSLNIWIEMMEASARRVELPGKVMKISGDTITGETFDIESLRGKFVLVYFWSSWCKPCREEYPYMKRIYEQYREQGFEIVAISVDEDRSKLESFVRELQVPWITLWDDERKTSPASVQEYGINAIPTMILLDREGKVISLEARGLILGSLLEKWLLGKPPQAK